MTPLPRRALGAVAVLIVLALSGCGDNDRKAQNEYVDEVNQVQDRFSSTYSRIASQITSTTTAREDRAALTQLEQALDETSAELRAVKPPSEVAELHSELVGVLRGYSAALSGLTDDLLSGNRARAAQATTLLASETTDASADFTRKVNEINARLRD